MTSYPEPRVVRGSAPVPELGEIKSTLGPSHISLRDLALGLQTGMVQIVDLTGDADDPTTWLDRYVDDGAKTGGSKGRYDPLAVYTSSTNRHDHRTQMRLNLSPDMMRAIKLIVGMVPQFGTDGGFVRDAIVHSLQWWAKRLDGFADAEVAGAVNFATMNAVIGSMREALEERKRVVGEVDELIDMAIADGDAGIVEMICDVHEVIAQGMADPGRGRVLESVKKGRGWAGEARRREAKRLVEEKIAKKREEEREAKWMSAED